MSITLTEPSWESEFEVQAFLYHELRTLGINVRGEVKFILGRRKNVRLDLAEFTDGKLSGVIEVKARPVKHKTSWKDTRQGRSYLALNVPVKIVYGLSDAQDLIEASRASGKIRWDLPPL